MLGSLPLLGHDGMASVCTQWCFMPIMKQKTFCSFSLGRDDFQCKVAAWSVQDAERGTAMGFACHLAAADSSAIQIPASALHIVPRQKQLLHQLSIHVLFASNILSPEVAKQVLMSNIASASPFCMTLEITGCETLRKFRGIIELLRYGSIFARPLVGDTLHLRSQEANTCCSS